MGALLFVSFAARAAGTPETGPAAGTALQGLLRWLPGLALLGAGVLVLQARRAQAGYQAIFNATNDAIFIHALPSGTLLDVNPRATELYGYRRDELLALPFEALCSGVPPHSPEEAMGWMRKAAAGPPQVFEWLARDQSGRLFWVEVNMRRAAIHGHERLVVAVRDFTERKQRNDELQRSRDLLASTSDSLFILASRTRRFVEVNETTCARLGYSQVELLGMRVEDVDPGFPIADWDHHLEAVKASPTGLKLETWHRRKDGGLLPVELQIRSVDLGGTDYLVASARDISERKASEAQLREAADFNAKLLASNAFGLQAFDAESGQCSMATPGAVAMTGGSTAQLLAQNFRTIASWAASGLLAAAEKALATGEDQNFEVATVSSFDKPVYASCRLTTMPMRGRPHLVLVLLDVTEQKLAELDKAKLQSQLHHSQKMESLGTLAGGVAHDMNNVLGAILGLASAHLEAHPPGSPAHRAFGTIIKASTRGGDMVKRLLSLAHQGQTEQTVLDLNAILHEVIHLLERTTLSRVLLSVDLEPGLRPLRGDAGALTHAIMNLCVNAVDAMPEQGTLTLRTRNGDGDRIEVDVDDTGTGMPREVMERAMEPFFTTKEMGKGTGLGLAMVYSTVIGHRGRIELHSAPGQGTQIRMTFPACQPTPDGTDAQAALPSDKAPKALDILLVDDDELIQTAIGEVVQSLGHAVTIRSSGEEALQALEAGYAPDVIILDLNMPGLGGSGTLPRLRSLSPEVPVLLATGRLNPAATALAAAHPFVTLLPKPFTAKGLRACLDGVLPG